MAEQNVLDRRVQLLADALKDRMAKVRTQIVEPRPYNQKPVSEENQVRKFLEVRDTGQLPALRERMGDEEVDRYVRAMTGRANKYLASMAERKFNESKEPTEEETTRAPGQPTASYYTADFDLESF